MSRPSDVLTGLRQIAGQLADTANTFEQYAKELAVLVAAGKLRSENFPPGHADTTLEEINSAVEAIAATLGAMSEQQKAAIIMIRK